MVDGKEPSCRLVLVLALCSLDLPAWGQSLPNTMGEDIRPASASGTDLNYTPPATLLPVVEQAITLADDQIDAFAAAHEIPVVNMYGLSHLLNQTVTMGGVRVTDLYSPDYFHPNTVGQGILADTVLDAFHKGYDVNVHRLRLSDQQILNEAHIAHQPGHSYFNVNPFVISMEDAHKHRGEHDGWDER
jgi:hypothetical protein